MMKKAKLKMKSRLNVCLHFVLASLAMVSFYSCCSAPPLISDDLLDCDTDKYKKPREENILLFNAAKQGNALACLEHLQNGANINVSDRLGQSALMWAAWQGSDDVVRTLLKFDAETRHRIQEKKIKSGRIPLLDFCVESNPKYNPLFALIASHGMQVPNAIECVNLLLENEKTFVAKSSLLIKEDSFAENIIHKAVRSGSLELLQFFITKLKALPDNKKTFHSCLNKINDSGESPLIVAVKSMNADMVELLIDEGADILIKDRQHVGLAELAFNRGKGDYQTYLVIMKARLRKHNEEKKKMKGKKGWHPLYTRKDKGLKDAIALYHELLDMKNREGDPFFQTFRKFEGTDQEVRAEDPNDLEDVNYKNKKLEFFTLLTSQHKSESDLEAINKLITVNPFLLECGYLRGTNRNELSALEIAIEERDEYLFDIIFAQTNMNTIHPSRVYGDYLRCAIKNNNPIVIRKLLEFNSNPTGVQGHIIENLMSPSINSAPHPIIEYLKYCYKTVGDNEDLDTQKELLGALLTYYKSGFKYNTSLFAPVFVEALDYDDEELLLLFYKHSSPKDGFYRAEKKNNRYLQFILLEKKYFRTLELFMKNSRFMEGNWYEKKDPQNQNKTFEEVLLASEDTDEIRMIRLLYDDLIKREKKK